MEPIVIRSQFSGSSASTWDADVPENVAHQRTCVSEHG